MKDFFKKLGKILLLPVLLAWTVTCSIWWLLGTMAESLWSDVFGKEK